MNLPPELTARIEEIAKEWSGLSDSENLSTYDGIRNALEDLAEPLHKEMEELRTENKAARSAENEWRETIQELRKEREFFEANSVYYQRQSDALEAQLAEAKKAAEKEREELNGIIKRYAQDRNQLAGD